MSDENLQQQEQSNDAPPPEHKEVESDARAQGWVSKDEYRGRDGDWVDAETFVQRGREILPIVRKNNERLLKELKEARAIAEEARTAAKEFQKFQKEQFERKAVELEREVASLKALKREAISQGDGDRVGEIEDQIDSIKDDIAVAKAESKRPEPVQQTQEVDPSFQNWIDNNQWFGVETKLSEVANGLGRAIQKDNPSLTGKAFFDKLDAELAETYPTRFGKKQKPNPMDAGTPTSGGRTQSRSKKSYENLPAEAKAACDRFLKQGLIKSKDDYVAEYDWSE